MLDIVARADGSVEQASDVAGTVRFRAGGSAANTARSFVRAGGRATFIGAVGRDAWARRLVAAVRAEGVTIHAVMVARPTGRIVVLVGTDGERSFVVERGAADLLEATDLDAAWFRACDVLHLPGYSLFSRPLADAAAGAAAIAHERGAAVSMDLSSRAPLLAMGRRRAWRVLDGLRPTILFGNGGEVAALAGERQEERLLQVVPILVVKEGAAGCRVLARSDDGADVLRLTVATASITARDTTGAGDAFDAGFLYSLSAAAKGEALPRDAGSLRRAAVAGHRASATVLRGPRLELADQ